jgi:hypothetical protein
VISRNEILGKLPPFKNYQVIVSQDQTTGEIIDGILATHEKYKKDYDKISEYFIGDNEIETAQNIFNFLKSNVPYYIEDTKNQTLRSPSAIFAMPGDCKSYSLAANGILSSLNRKGYFKIPLAYRFASYKDNKEIQHVFSVLYPGTNKEIWIDPVLKRFNEKRQPTFYKDKKLKMALIAMSGVESANKTEQLEAYRDRLVNERDRLLVNGQIAPGSSKELQYKVAINTVTRQIQQASISGFDNIAMTVGNFYMAGDETGSETSDNQDNSKAIADALKLLTELFANKPNPNDWMGWDALDVKIGAPSGTNVLQWVILDGDSVENEALNIVSYIKAKGFSKLLGYSTWFKRTITINDIADKLARGGFQQEAAMLRSGKQIGPVTPGITPGSTNVAGMNIWVILALAGAGIYLVTKKK